VEYVQADLFFFPKQDAAQRVLSLSTEPNAEQHEDALRYRWERPGRDLRYEARSAVEVSNYFPRVTRKIPFPLTSLPPEARDYLDSSEHIDSTHPSIVSLANKLAQGKDDLFVIVSEIAIWTKNNIEYNLSTLTADVSQKASWVLQNKYGVCDELTSLFIALLRALGIPARFVTGVSYTASPLFPDRWGAHGWAEVYFPDVGWVPFDPTFGEFGWVDPGHVKMMTSMDPAAPSVRFEWRGTNADLQFTEPDIDARVTGTGERIDPVVALSVKPLYDDVGFGQHNLIQATVENLQPYYVTAEIRLSRVGEMEVLDPYDRQVILQPQETKNVFWRTKIDEALNERFVYTIPLSVSTAWHDTGASSFTARAQGAEHAKLEVTRVMNTLADEEEQPVTRDLDLRCSTDKPALYPDETAVITCALRNLGTAPLGNVRVCVEEKQCKAIDLGISQERTLEFTQSFTAAGSKTLFIRASNSEFSKTLPLPLVMNDVPAVNITKLAYPETVSYGDPFSVVFALTPASKSTPKNVRVTVRTGSGSRTFEMPELPGEQAFEVELDSSVLGLGTTAVQIEARFDDGKSRERSTRVSAQVELTGVPWYMTPVLWLRGLMS
jgi:transglutaminase-like putative cysteine protease